MMKKFVGISAWILGVAAPAPAQVQIFEQDLAGLHFYTGTLWNSKITQPYGALEYSIEGRTSLGVRAGLPVKDSLSFDPDLKAYFANPYIMFEFIEPGNLTVLSFSMRADYIYEDVRKPSDNFNLFTRSRYGGGPVFALRFHASEKVTAIPEAAYQLFFVTWRKNHLGAPDPDNPGGIKNIHDNENSLWHDVSGGVNLLLRVSEMQGLHFHPRVILRIGPGLQNSDFLNLDLALGYFLSF